MNKFRLQVTSYNILSSKLAGVDQFCGSDPNDLQREVRLPRIFAKLEPEIKNNSIIAIQELSRDWVGDFHRFFQSNKYSMITSLYGRTFNGYMGVALAYPHDIYSLEDCETFRVADDIKDYRPITTLSLMQHLVRWTRWFSFTKPAEEPIDPWSKSLDRQNTFIFSRFKSKLVPSAESFCVATYHMPCAFYCPPIMVIHVAELIRQCQKLAENYPLIVLGDFNFMPDSSMYKLVTTGNIDKSDPAYPLPNGEWEIKIEPMESAYATINGEEPETTNFPTTESGFTGTLDYIFYRDIQPVNVLKLASPSDKNQLQRMPNKTEPSDHLLINSTFEL